MSIIELCRSCGIQGSDTCKACGEAMTTEKRAKYLPQSNSPTDTELIEYHPMFNGVYHEMTLTETGNQVIKLEQEIRDLGIV